MILFKAQAAAIFFPATTAMTEFTAVMIKLSLAKE
jgi:hypothetical protein